MRQKLALVVKVGVSAALLYFVLRKVDLASVGNRLHDINFIWLAAALGVLTVQMLLNAFRWRLIAELCSIFVTFRRTFRFIMIGIFFNQALPSSIGGDAVRAWLLVRDGASWASSTYSVLIDRIVGLFALAVFVVGSLAWAFVLIINPAARLTLLIIGFGAIAGIVAFTLLRHLRDTALTRWSVIRHLVQLSTLAGDTLLSLKAGPIVIILSLCIQFLTVLSAWCLGKAAQAPLEFLQALVLIPPVMLISTLPVSIAGWGVRETALVLAFGYAGLSQTDGLIVSLLLGALMVAIGIAGGIVWLMTTPLTPKSSSAQSDQSLSAASRSLTKPLPR